MTTAIDSIMFRMVCVLPFLPATPPIVPHAPADLDGGARPGARRRATGKTPAACRMRGARHPAIVRNRIARLDAAHAWGALLTLAMNR
ncbi:hypothetical protein GCM10010219_22210 [Streptomyces netropsis]|nr:hypothetical protein GCM10010219_22210 [Streptomyces netropsis]